MYKYSQFKQAVRKYAPSALLPSIATKSSAIAAETLSSGSPNTASLEANVAYSAIARISLLYGNEHRDKAVDDKALEELVRAFWAASDPVASPDFDAWALMAAFMYEQFGYQFPARDELTRSYLMLCETSVEESVSHPDADAWKDLLGASIEQIFTAAFMFYISAIHHDGYIDVSFLEDERYQKFEPHLPAEVARNVLRLLTASIEDLKDDAREASSRAPLLTSYERFDYNPLTRTPLVRLHESALIAPQPEFIIRAVHPENLYYRGMRKWADQQFGKAYGFRVEAYTGMQLQHTGKHHVIPEFKYLKDGSEAASSDWFLVTPQATFIIECKSARMSLIAKAGSESFPKVYKDHIQKAFKQLDENASNIQGGNEFYAHIPNDRPLIGLVVTAEPLYNANDPSILDSIKKPKIPVLTLSLRDIENLATLEPTEVGKSLMAITQDTTSYSWNISESIRQVLNLPAFPTNSLMSDTFDRIFLPTLNTERPGD